ncbi:hypothetical protein Tco_0726785 [Tanacetum coccineum]|uniref:Uncharacterized protein n=1 Tax=Tanacetum coccineum TaxID=301880 RepID=A0ABQ4YGK1_9ASTR
MSLRKLGYNVIASLAVLLIGLGGLEFSEFVQILSMSSLFFYYLSSKSAKFHLYVPSSLAVPSSGLSSDVSDAGLPSEKESSRPAAGVKVNSSPGVLDSSIDMFLVFFLGRSSTVISRILILRPKLMTEECDRAPDNRFPNDVTFVNYWCIQAMHAFW